MGSVTNDKEVWVCKVLLHVLYSLVLENLKVNFSYPKLWMETVRFIEMNNPELKK